MAADCDEEARVRVSRRRGGVIRQLDPDAAQQRQAASEAAAVKRKASAMSAKEAKAKKALHKKEVRAQKKEQREAAAAAAAAARQVTLRQLNELLEAAHLEEYPDDEYLECLDDFEEVDGYEWDAFRAWVAEEEDELDIDNCVQFYTVWAEKYVGPREEWLRREETQRVAAAKAAAAARPRGVLTVAQSPAPPAPSAPDDDDPDDPYGGSADCFYEGPNDHDIAEQRARQEQMRRGQPGFVRLTLAVSSHRVKTELSVIKEDYNDGYEIDQERWYNDDARRSSFYGVPAGDLSQSAAAPIGWVPPSGLPVAEQAATPQPFRDNVAVYGPVANKQPRRR